MEIYDITLPLSDQLLTYPGDPEFELKFLREIAADGYVLSSIRMGSHAGTHIDAPAHFIPDGTTVDRIDLGILSGPAQVLDTGSADIIDQKLLSEHQIAAPRILFKTRNSKQNLLAKKALRSRFVALSADGADYLVQQGVVLVGIDYLSIERPQALDYPCHVKLLQHGVVILEGADLHQVPEGEYILHCLPLKIVNGDAAPVRAILIRD